MRWKKFFPCQIERSAFIMYGRHKQLTFNFFVYRVFFLKMLTISWWKIHNNQNNVNLTIFK